MSRLSYKTLFIILFFLLIPVVFLLKINQKSTKTLATWWNDSWMYRQSINISSHTSVESNVYITTTINIGDTSKAQIDDGDFRFLDQSGQLLDYYIVSGTGTTAITFHIQLDSFPGGAQTLYAYYGNPSAPNAFSSSDFSTAASNYTIGSLGAEETGGAPVAWWKFDEGVGTTAYDSSSNHNNGLISGAIWKSNSECISGGCIYNGTTSDNYVQTPDVYLIPQTYTLSIWVKGNKNNQVSENIYTLGWDNKISLILQDTSKNPASGILIRNAADSSYVNANTGINILDNKWHQLTATVDRNTLQVKIYIDGKLQKSQTISDHYSGSAKLNVGAWTTIYGNFNGFIDEAKIYPYVRSAIQIAQDYNTGLSGQSTSKGSNTSFGSSSTKSLNDGLVGYWKFDEGTGTTSADSSGNSNTATFGIGDSAPSWTTGKYGIGISLNGLGSYTAATGTTSLSSANAWTISTWIKPSDTVLSGSDIQALISKWSNSNGRYINYFLGINTNGKLYTTTSRSTGDTTATVLSGGSTLIPGNWYMATATFDGSTQKLSVYLNNKLDGQTNTGFTQSYINSGNVTFGKYDFTWSLYRDKYLGIMDEVRVYNRALSSAEVSALYNYAPGPVAYYKFDEGVGTTVYDSSGNGNNGTWSGTPGNQWSTGKYGKAGNFNGTDNFVNLGTPELLKIKNQSFTIGFWFNTIQGVTDYQTILGNSVTGAWSIMSFQNSLYFRPKNVGGTAYDFSTYRVPITNNQWTYATFVVNRIGNAMTVSTYSNSTLLGTSTKDVVDSFDAAVSYYLWRNSFNVPGKLDDVKIYNYARTQEQILQDMQGSSLSNKLSGPIAWYKFDEGQGTTIHDYSKLHNGISVNNPTWIQGKNGKGLQFNSASQQYIQITGSPSDFDQTSNTDRTVSLWINSTDTTSSVQTRIIGRDLFNPNGYWWWNWYQGKPSLESRDNDSVACGAAQLSTNIADGKWHYIALVMDHNNSLITSYLDGAKSNSSAIGCTGTFIGDANDYLKIGGQNTNLPFNGSIDEVKYFNYALSSDEIKSDYNQSSSAVFGVTNLTVGNTSNSAIYCVPGSTDPCSPPVAEWKFDEGLGTTAYDTSGNGNNGTFGAGSSAPTWTTGKIGKALKFNSNNYVITNLLAGTPPMTISLWAKGTSGNIFHQGTDEGNYRHYLNVNSNTLAWSYYDGSNKIVSTAWDSSKWNFITLVHTGSQLQLYVNNILSSTLPANSNTSYGVFRMGIRGLSISPWNGSIDQVRIYNYARTPAQIAWDYNQGAPIAWYKFDECQGSIVHDSSGLGNTGAISIGASGTQTSVGTCTTSDTAWGNGASGKTNSSINFDGTDDYINTNTNSTMKVQANSFSLWINANDLNAYRGLFEIVSATSSRRYSRFMSFGSNEIRYHISYDDFPNSYVSFPNVPLNKWVHLVGTWDGTTIKSYINGTKSNETNFTSSIPYDGNVYLKIGLDPSRYFNGQIDDVRIYNYALTPDQIKVIYNGGAINFN